MKKTTLLQVGISLGMLLSASLSVQAQNLIVNGSAETPPYDTIPSGWVNVQGNWTSPDSTSGSFSAEDGAHYFFEGDDSLGILQQDVNVSSYATSIDASNQQFVFNGYVQSYDQDPADLSRIVVKCLSSTLTVLYTFDSDTIGFVGGWKLVADTFVAPVGTRSIRVQLISTRQNGTDNDASYDNLSLTTRQLTGIKNLALQTIPLTVAPNPSHAVFSVQADVDAGNEYNMTVTDLTGRIIYQERFAATTPLLKKSVSLNSVPTGIYFLHFMNTSGTKQAVSKLIIQ